MRKTGAGYTSFDSKTVKSSIKGGLLSCWEQKCPVRDECPVRDAFLNRPCGASFAQCYAYTNACTSVTKWLLIILGNKYVCYEDSQYPKVKSPVRDVL